MAEETKLIKIDFLSILKIALLVLGILIVYFLRDIILMFVVALLLATVMSPAVDWFEKKKIPRWLGSLIIYLIVLSIVIGLILIALPIIKSESRLFLYNLPDFVRSLVNFFQKSPQELPFGDWFSGRTGSIYSFFSTLTGQIFSIFMIFVLAFYISVEKREVRNLLLSIVPKEYHHFVENFLAASQEKIGAWGRGMLILSLTIGILSYIGLTILGVRFALILALIAALTEIIPWIGPWLGAIPALIVGFADSFLKGILVGVLYLVIQQLENTFIAPYVMKKSVGLKPLVTILVLLVGGKIAGLWGMILSVPVTTLIFILVNTWFKEKERRDAFSKVKK